MTASYWSLVKQNIIPLIVEYFSLCLQMHAIIQHCATLLVQPWKLKWPKHTPLLALIFRRKDLKKDK